METTIKITTIKELQDIINKLDENTMLTVTFSKAASPQRISFKETCARNNGCEADED